MYVSLSKDRTGIIVLISKNSPWHCLYFSKNVLKLISHIGVPGLLSLNPTSPHTVALPLSGRLSIPLSSYLSACTSCALSLWLITESQGSSSPCSPGLSLSATQSFISGTIQWPLGRKQSGLRSWLRREGQARSHRGSGIDLNSVLRLPFIL